MINLGRFKVLPRESGPHMNGEFVLHDTESQYGFGQTVTTGDLAVEHDGTIKFVPDDGLPILNHITGYLHKLSQSQE